MNYITELIKKTIAVLKEQISKCGMPLCYALTILNSKKSPMIFISHSSKDKQYVSKIVTLLEGIGLDQTQVFCSSFPGYGIPVGCDILDYLRTMFDKYELHVIIIHSENYYNSSICLNEMGAAWVKRCETTSILLPEFDFAKMNGAIGNREIAIKLDEDELLLENQLDQLYNSLVNEFDIKWKSDFIWEQNRISFLNSIKAIQ